LLASTAPELAVLTNIRPDRISGIELSRRLIASAQGFPVIFLTAIDRDVVRQETVQTGFVAFSRKVSSPQPLLGAIERHRPMIGSDVGKSNRYRDIVAQAEAIALANAEEMPTIPAICCELSVSPRTLRKAFRSIYGQSPCRRLRVLRLNQARQALLAVDGETAKVTEIAICFGFFEFGRFSVEYRKLFGESPSQTLRSAGRYSETPCDDGAELRSRDAIRIDDQIHC